MSKPATDEQVTLEFPTGEKVETSIAQMEAVNACMRHPMLPEVVAYVIKEQKVSTSLLQRIFAVGYNRAAGWVEEMENLGIVTCADHLGKRDVAMDEVPPYFENMNRAAEIADKHARGRPPMKETDADREVRDQSYAVSADELRQFIERWERLDAERRDIVDQQKEVMAEAKGRGYDTKVMRIVIAQRKREPDDLAEEEAVLDMYKSALGM